MRTWLKTELLVLAAAFVAAAALVYPEVWAAAEEVSIDRTVGDASEFELVIAADKNGYTVGERPVITATLTNTSDEDVMLVRLLDGSDFGRFPQFAWTVTAPKDAAPVQPIGRCGNTNPITSDAFFTLPAGESVELNTPWCPAPSHELNRGPGRYTIQATYSTDGEDAYSWIGGPLTDRDFRTALRQIGPLLEQVPRVTVKSNKIDIRFRASE